jgi:hypothetical protein
MSIIKWCFLVIIIGVVIIVLRLMIKMIKEYINR